MKLKLKGLQQGTTAYLILICIFAALLRFINLGGTPPSLNWDEVSHGYNAYSILKTGKDEWGIGNPSIFRAYGDYKLPVYIYLTAASESIFGLNELSVRFPSVVAGIGLVIVSFFLTRELLDLRGEKRNWLALVVAFLVSIEPWTLFASRAAFEANLATFFLSSGVLFVLLAFRKNPWLLALAAVSLGLSVWTYNSARIVTPLLIIGLLFILRKEFLKLVKSTPLAFLGSSLIVGIFLIPMFIQLISPSGSARFGFVQILDEGAIGSIIESRTTTSLPSILSRLVYNRPVYLGTQVIKNYVSYFSPDFLFLNGGSQYQFSVPGFGLLSLVNLPFFYLGLFILFKNIKTKWAKLLLVWLLLAPIPGSITRDAPHVLRTLLINPVPMITVVIGIHSFMQKFKRLRVFTLLYFVLLLAFLFTYLNNYTNSYRTNYSWAWQYGYKEAVLYAKLNYEKFDKIIITKKYGEPHEFVLFYNQWNPESYRSDPSLVRYTQSGWWWTDSFDKYLFVNDWQMPKEGRTFVTESKMTFDCTGTRCLLITSPGNAPASWRKLETITLLDNKPVFELYEN